jgi:hypothetical protein
MRAMVQRLSGRSACDGFNGFRENSDILATDATNNKAQFLYF